MVINTNVAPPRIWCESSTTASVQRTPQRHLPWRWVYALLPLLIGLLFAARRQPLTRGGHLIMQCAIVLLIYGLLALWLYTNRTALRPAPVASPRRLVYVIEVTAPNGATQDGIGKQYLPSSTKHTVQQLMPTMPQASLPLSAGLAVDEVRNISS